MDILESLNTALFPGYKYIMVDGVQEAENYNTPRDCSLLMLDKNKQYLYIKEVDLSGKVTNFERYKLIEEKIPKLTPENFVTKQEFEKFQEEVLDAISAAKSAK